MSRIIEHNEEGQKLLDEYKELVRQLTGFVLEFKDNQVILLSPIFRELLFNKAKEVETKHWNICNYLCIDWIERKKKEVEL